jgi:glycosyltransferase involved in cell wall biosynthesis
MVSDSGCPTDGTAVTFEDMTVAQAQRHPEYLGLPYDQLALWRTEQGRLYARADACCAGSHWTAESIRSDYGVDPEKVHVVGRGHGLEIAPPPRDWSVPRFLFLGRDWQRKNGDAVLRAFAALRAELPGATLHVVGRHPRLDLPGVHGHGELLLEREADRERLGALYREATCFVMPSKVEAFGISYVEAASFGVPSVGTTVGGAATAIGPDGGLLVDPGDDGALLGALREAADPERAAAMGAAATERAKLFTWPQVAERLARALLPALSRERSLAPFLD